MKDNFGESLGVDFDLTPSDVNLDLPPLNDEVKPLKKEKSLVTTNTVDNLPTVVYDVNNADDEDEKADFQHSRKSLRDIIDIGKDALEGIRDLAAQTDEPRAYEVVAITMKSINETIKNLYELHAMRKRVKEGKVDDKGTNSNQGIINNIDKAVFVGTSEEFLDRMKEKQAETNKLIDAEKQDIIDGEFTISRE